MLRPGLDLNDGVWAGGPDLVPKVPGRVAGHDDRRVCGQFPGEEVGIQMVLVLMGDDDGGEIAVVSFPQVMVARELEPARVKGPARGKPRIAGDAHPP